jgi:predicted enzyme related to lactoylglutathione lyase
MSGSIRWFEITGRDGIALREFYSGVFGWRIGAGDPANGFDHGLVEPGYGGIAGTLGSSREGLAAHATFFVEVESPSATLRRLERLGGRAVMEERQVTELNMRIAYFEDPEGHLVGLSNNAGVGGRGDAGTNAVLSFEVMGRNPEALRAFYASLFGWRMREAGAFGYWMVEAGGESVLGGIGPVSAAGTDGDGFATVKVEVDDPAAILDRAERLGGRVVLPARDVPDTSLQIAYLSDSEGNVIGLTRGMPFSAGLAGRGAEAAARRSGG